MFLSKGNFFIGVVLSKEMNKDKKKSFYGRMNYNSGLTKKK